MLLKEFISHSVALLLIKSLFFTLPHCIYIHIFLTTAVYIYCTYENGYIFLGNNMPPVCLTEKKKKLKILSVNLSTEMLLLS